MKKFYHSLPVQIRFNDVDMARHINNSAYNEFFDLGRLDYFIKVIGRNMDFDGISLVIASIHIDFFKPIFLDDQIKVRSKVISIGNKSLDMVQEITRKGESAPAASATTVMVCFDYLNQTSVLLPDVWIQKIREFEQMKIS